MCLTCRPVSGHKYAIPRSKSPSEPNTSTARLKISRTVRRSRVHYCIHRSYPLVPILRQINPIHALPYYFFKIYSNLRLSSKWPLPFRFAHQNSHLHFYSTPTRATRHSPIFDHTDVWWGVKTWSSSICNFLQFPDTEGHCMRRRLWHT
jgi:hypothetical protein